MMMMMRATRQLTRHRGDDWCNLIRMCNRFQHSNRTVMTKVNAWTEWGTLRDVVIGDAHGM